MLLKLMGYIIFWLGSGLFGFLGNIFSGVIADTIADATRLFGFEFNVSKIVMGLAINVVLGTIWGIICIIIAKKKGYSADAFLQGFCFGIVGVCICANLPFNKKTA